MRTFTNCHISDRFKNKIAHRYMLSKIIHRIDVNRQALLSSNYFKILWTEERKILFFHRPCVYIFTLIFLVYYQSRHTGPVGSGSRIHDNTKDAEFLSREYLVQNRYVDTTPVYLRA